MRQQIIETMAARDDGDTKVTPYKKRTELPHATISQQTPPYPVFNIASMQVD